MKQFYIGYIIYCLMVFTPGIARALEVQSKINDDSVELVNISIKCKSKRHYFTNIAPYRTAGLYVPSLILDTRANKIIDIGPCNVTYTLKCFDDSTCGTCQVKFESAAYKNVVLETANGNPDRFDGKLKCTAYGHWLP